MASVIAQGVGTIFAAVAFSGSSFLFKQFDKNGYSEEMKRHNKALEDLAFAKEKFYENEEKLRNKRIDRQVAASNIEDTNKALDFLQKVNKIVYKGRTFDREPTLEDFYKPSDKMKDYGYLFTAATATGLGVGLAFLI